MEKKDRGLQYLKDLQKATVIHPKPGESTDKPVSEQLRKKYEDKEIRNRVKNTVKEDVKMNYEVIIQIGRKLRKSDIDNLSIQELYSILRKATRSFREDTLKRYVQILKDEKFIKFNNKGLWEIIRDE